MKYQWGFNGNVATFIALQTMWQTPPSNMNLRKDALQASNLGPGKFMRSIRFPFSKFLLLQNLSKTILK